MRACVAVIALHSACWVPLQVEAQADGSMLLPQRRGVSWDAQLEGGLGIALRNDLPHSWFGRARVGMLVVHEPLIFAFGPTVEVGGLIGLGVGGQVDLIHLATGMSLEAGGAAAASDELVTHLSLGYSIFGLEWQHRFARQSADALMFRLRVPVGVIAFLWSHR